MSGIFGLFFKDSAPAEAAFLRSMAKAMPWLGPDGIDTWSEGPCGLGRLLRHDTPEALHDRMPRALENGQAVMTAQGRLDNRDELADALAVPAGRRSTTADSELMTMAYLRWDEACVDHLFGDWSLAVWRPDERRLFLARDQHGITALYYIDTPRFFAFASSKKALLALPLVRPRLNEWKLADHLAHFQGDPAQTFFRDILHLLCAHTLTVTPGRTEKKRYWHLENVPDVRLSNVQAYAEGLRDMLTRTVRSQMRSRREVGLEMSGGLDSCGLAAIAAPMLAERGKALFTYTAVPVKGETVPTGNRVADESAWARSAVRHVGNIRDHYRDFAHFSPVTAIETVLDILDAPTMGWGNAPWLLGIRELAQKQGVDVLMNGFMGNASASWRGLLRSQPWPVLLRHGLLKAGLRDKLLPLIPYGAVRWLKRRRFGKDSWRNWSLIAPEFARRMRLAERLACEDHDLTFWLPRHQWLLARAQRLLIMQPGQWQGAANYAEMGAWYGLDSRTPLADARLMAYCLGIPDRFYFAGVERGLFRRALAGQLPAEVLTNPRRGLQGADLATRLRTYRDAIDGALAEVRAVPGIEGFVNSERLQAAWSLVRNASTTDHNIWMQARGVMHGLATGLFLHRLSQRGSLP